MPRPAPIRPRSRRGVALLLVLVVTGTAAGLGAIHLSARSSAPHLAANRERSVAGRHAIAGVLEATAHLVATEQAWRSSGGNLFNSVGVGGCLVRAEVSDLQTGLAPNAQTRAVRIETVAERDGVRQRGELILRVGAPQDEGVVTCDLSEIAVAARESITIRDRSAVAALPTASLAPLGDPIVLGTVDLRPDAISVDATATVVDALALAPGDGDDLARGHRGLPEALPFPAPPPAPALPPPTAVDAPVRLSGNVDVPVETGHSAYIQGSRVTTFRLAGRVATARDFSVTGGGRVVVENALTVAVGGDLLLDGVTIELAPGASLTFHVAGKARLRNAILSDGTALAAGGGRVRLFGHGSGTGTAVDWTIEGDSRLAGEVYAPGRRIELRDTATIVGRLAGSSVRLGGDAVLLYDPAFDRGNGLSEPRGPARGPDGKLRAGLKDMASLDDAEVAAKASAARVALRKRGGPALGVPDPDAKPVTGAPTRLSFGDTP